MIEIASASVDQTRRIAAAIAPLVQAGDLVLLCGELGAGKTAFVQGFGAALGVTEAHNVPGTVSDSNWSRRLDVAAGALATDDRLTELLDG